MRDDLEGNCVVCQSFARTVAVKLFVISLRAVQVRRSCGCTMENKEKGIGNVMGSMGCDGSEVVMMKGKGSENLKGVG